MLNPLKVITFARKSKQGYQNPDEFIHELSFSFVGAYFTIGIIILSILTLGSILLGFIANLGFFKVVTFLFALGLGATIKLFITVKKKARNTTAMIINEFKNSNSKVIAVEPNNQESSVS